MYRMLSTCCNSLTTSQIWDDKVRKIVTTPEPVCSSCCKTCETVKVPVDVEQEELTRSRRGFGSGWSSRSEWYEFKFAELAYELRDER